MDDVGDPSSFPALGYLTTVIALLGASAFFSGAEIAFLAVGQTRLRELADQGSPVARLLLAMRRRRAWVLCAILLGITASNYFAEHFAVRIGTATLGPTIGPIVAFAAITAVVLIFCETLPMQRALRRSESTALVVAVPVAAFSVALSPVILVLTTVARGLLWLLGAPGGALRPRLTEQHLKAMIEQGEEAGAIPTGQRRMLHSVLEFGEQTVAEVMTPRTDMVAIEADRPVAEALALGLEGKHSRLPVYERVVDHIIGILSVKDLLVPLRDGRMNAPCREFARPPLHVPESLRVDALLRQLQSRRQLMAIVRDEFGGTAGLVTVEDALEQIVGDIFDEYDVAEPDVCLIAEGELVCDPVVSLREIQEHLDTELPVDEFDSLGGLVMSLAQHIPVEGETLQMGRLEFIVEATDGPRLERVRVIEHPVDEPEGATGGQARDD